MYIYDLRGDASTIMPHSHYKEVIAPYHIMIVLSNTTEITGLGGVFTKQQAFEQNASYVFAIEIGLLRV